MLAGLLKLLHLHAQFLQLIGRLLQLRRLVSQPKKLAAVLFGSRRNVGLGWPIADFGGLRLCGLQFSAQRLVLGVQSGYAQGLRYDCRCQRGYYYGDQ